jgi:hypothetical protein
MGANPFLELEEAPRKLGIDELRGAKKKLWDEFVRRYAAGEFDGIATGQLHTWVKKHLKISINQDTLRRRLYAAKDAHDAR